LLYHGTLLIAAAISGGSGIGLLRANSIERALCAVLWLLAPWAVLSAHAQPASTISVTIGRDSVSLDGPWKFRTGDNPAWAEPALDDSSWESVDLTPDPDARDNDVGLPGYVAGWQARGHPGYYGFAWYRLRVTASAPAGARLALAGPLAVDSAYELYANGHLLGGVGDFSGSTPTAYSIHRPALFPLPPDISGGAITLAIRVWLAQWPRAPGEGGIHIAPLIGTLAAVSGHYRLQWLTLFEGYVVDGVEGLLLLLLALMASMVRPFDRNDAAYLWVAAASLLLAIHRGNQAVMFLGSFETLREFELFILVLAVPLYTGAWVMAWRAWLEVRMPVWIAKAVGGLTVVYMLAAFLSRSWFRGVFPEALFTMAPWVIAVARWGLLLLYVLTAYQGIRQRGGEGWSAAALMAVLAAGIFGGELHYLGTPGIWFPFGIGLSLSECAYAAFVPLMALLLLKRLFSYARLLRAGRDALSPAG
jgi:hypothetical protein